MSNMVTISQKNLSAASVEAVLLRGDLSKLNEEQRLSYYDNVCKTLGLNALTRPFEYITLNGKLTLYAKRDATDQLRNLHKVSVKISSREKLDDVFMVTAQASTPDGRTDESVGAVNVSGLKGDILANALMKAETKAKRRVTLSICGLGLLDETEIEAIPEIKKPVGQVLTVEPTVEAKKKTSLKLEEVESPQKEESIPECCGKPMMISKYLDRDLGHHPFYCKSCKNKIPRPPEEHD